MPKVKKPVRICMLSTTIHLQDINVITFSKKACHVKCLEYTTYCRFVVDKEVYTKYLVVTHENIDCIVL